MKLKYRLQKHATNEFTALTGIRSIQLRGKLDCIVVGLKKYRSWDVQRYAWCVYQGDLNPVTNSSLEMSTTCGIDNCVKKEHLIVTYNPTKKEAQYIQDNKYLGLEWISHTMKVPPSVLQARFPDIKN